MITTAEPETSAPASLAEIEPAEYTTQRDIGRDVRASWPFSTDTLRENLSVYSEEARELLIAAFLFCTDHRHPVSKPNFAKCIGLSDNTVYKIWSAKHKHPITGELYPPSAELLQSIRDFLADQKERRQLKENDFVVTPTAKKIFTACDLARESRTPVFLVGPSHIGKSWSLELAYTPDHNHGNTTYCRMQAASGLGGMVRAIADSMSISDKTNTAALIDRIVRALPRNHLLILDELHLLANTYRKQSFFACMEVLREIHDRTKTGMVLCFTLLDEVRAAKQKELQQFWRRGVHKVFLPLMPTKDDVRLILEHHGLQFPETGDKLQLRDGRATITEEPYKLIKQLAREEALKSITERIRYGKKLARKRDEKFTMEHFVRAHLLIAKQAQQEGEWDAAERN